MYPNVPYTIHIGHHPLRNRQTKRKPTNLMHGFSRITLPETNSSHPKMDGWNTSFPLGWPIFRCFYC